MTVIYLQKNNKKAVKNQAVGQDCWVFGIQGTYKLDVQYRYAEI